MATLYVFPPRPEMPAEVQLALLRAAKRWGKQAAVRIEDVLCGQTVFRPRYRVGHQKGGFVASTTPFFIEHGAGETLALALEDADRQERRP